MFALGRQKSFLPCHQDVVQLFGPAAVPHFDRGQLGYNIEVDRGSSYNCEKS